MSGHSGHISVLAREVCDAFDGVLPPRDAEPSGVFVDGTCGLGGHTQAVLDRFAPRRSVAIDRDPSALKLAEARLGPDAKVELVNARFSALDTVLDDLGIERVTAVVADLGVSSMQFDQAQRGFSFREDGPLDMRMGDTGPTAAEFLATVGAPELTRVLREYGEETDAKRIAAAIVAARPTSTAELADVVASAMSAPQRRKLGLRIHPATKTFMAIRIHLNDELGELDRFLEHAPRRLAVGGRLAIISFHSLEDRRVKRRFAKLSRVEELPGLPVREDERPTADFIIPRAFRSGVTPGKSELDANPRSRSARVRVLERAA